MDEGINVNPFMASGANGTMIDDFGGDNFDHSQLGFIGGQYVGAIMTNGRRSSFIRRHLERPDGGCSGRRRSPNTITTPFSSSSTERQLRTGSTT